MTCNFGRPPRRPKGDDMENLPEKFEWGTVWAVSGPNAMTNRWEPNKEQRKLLHRMGDKGFLFATSRFDGINFGERIKGAKGPMPFTPPIKEGSYVCPVNTEDGDGYLLCNAQQWSLLRAYQMGLEDGKKNAD